jgi:hypothetical protein
MSIRLRRALLASALVVCVGLPVGKLTAAGFGTQGGVPPRPLYGNAGDLVRLDPTTLRPLPGRRVPLVSDTWAWSYAPGRAQLALASDDPGPELRLVDLRRMRLLGDARLARRGSTWATAWVSPQRILAVVITDADDTIVAGVDPASRRVVWRRTLGGSLRVGQRFRRSLVLVLGPRGRIGESRFVRVTPDGRLHSASLPEIRSGSETVETEADGGSALDSRPGLAIDRPARRAFVVPAEGPVAEVDLRTLQVRSHVLHRAPAVGAARSPDAVSAGTRDALWLGNGLLAITGFDSHFSPRTGDSPGRSWTTPAGLALVDVRSWSGRTIDDRATAAARVGGSLMASSFVESGRKLSGSGLTAYSFAGERRFHRYGDEPIGVEPLGRRVLVAGLSTIALIDARTGRELRRFRRLPASPLFGEQSFPPTAAG